ncbi:MAG TPA: hypothetical protein VKB14_15585 [Actinomycetales bacterium]|nr:hypothetical protein [Actinomycetales bacterium]
MNAQQDHRSRWQRVYDALFRIFGPAQVSEAESRQTEVTERQRASAQATEQWEKETRDGRTYLVKRSPDDPDDAPH